MNDATTLYLGVEVALDVLDEGSVWFRLDKDPDTPQGELGSNLIVLFTDGFFADNFYPTPDQGVSDTD